MADIWISKYASVIKEGDFVKIINGRVKKYEGKTDILFESYTEIIKQS